MNLSGTSLRSEQVLRLAELLDKDELAVKLERAVANSNSIVALSTSERQRIVDVIEETHAPSALGELQHVLREQLVRAHRKQEQERRNREHALLMGRPAQRQ